MSGGVWAVLAVRAGCAVSVDSGSDVFEMFHATGKTISS